MTKRKDPKHQAEILALSTLWPLLTDESQAWVSHKREAMRNDD